MTNSEIYRLAKVIYDEARTPSETEPKFAIRYQNARLVWQEFHYRMFELSEESRSHLRPFLREHLVGNVSEFPFNQIPNNPRFITAMLADFTFNCLSTTRKRTIPIPAKPINHGLMNMTDSWNQPNDTDPYYIESGTNLGSYFKVLSTNVPENLTVMYLKYPNSFQLVQSPNGTPEESDAAIKEIVNYTIKSKEYSFENYNRFRAIDTIQV